VLRCRSIRDRCEYDALDLGAAAAYRGCDLDRVAREFGVWVRAGGAGQQLAREQVQHRREVELALVGGDFGDVPTPLDVRCRGGEIAVKQVREFRRRRVLLRQSLPVLGFSPLQALPTHGVGDGVHAHRPPILEQVSVDAR
jgi:hypothetical protein